MPTPFNKLSIEAPLLEHLTIDEEDMLAPADLMDQTFVGMSSTHLLAAVFGTSLMPSFAFNHILDFAGLLRKGLWPQLKTLCVPRLHLQLSDLSALAERKELQKLDVKLDADAAETSAAVTDLLASNTRLVSVRLRAADHRSRSIDSEKAKQRKAPVSSDIRSLALETCDNGVLDIVMPRLEVLQMQTSRVTSLWPLLSSCSGSLRDLRLVSLPLIQFAATLVQLPCLRSLGLHDCGKITDECVAALCRACPGAETVRVVACPLIGSKSLRAIASLEYVASVQCFNRQAEQWDAKEMQELIVELHSRPHFQKLVHAPLPFETKRAIVQAVRATGNGAEERMHNIAERSDSWFHSVSSSLVMSC
jgi:hypothetical protein